PTLAGANHPPVVSARPESSATPREALVRNELGDRRVRAETESRPVEERTQLQLAAPFDFDVLGVAVKLRPASGLEKPRPDALGRGGDEEFVAGEHGGLLRLVPHGEGDSDALELRGERRRRVQSLDRGWCGHCGFLLRL